MNTKNIEVKIRKFETFEDIIRRFDVFLISALLIANTVFNARIFEFWIPGITQISIAITFFIVAIYLFVAMKRNNYIVLFSFLFLFSYIMFQCVLFELNTGLGFNLNAGISVATVTMMVAVYESKLPLGRLLGIMIIVFTSYLIIYIATYPILINQPKDIGFLMFDNDRGVRVYLANSCAPFVLFAGIYLIHKKPAVGAALIALAAFSIYLTGSRVFQAITLGITLAAVSGIMAPWSRRPAAMVISIIFLCLSMAGVLAFFVEDFNPYEHFVSDGSGYARFHELKAALQSFHGRYFTGLGISPSLEVTREYTKSLTPFFESDLGAAGIMFTYGIFGCAAFLLASVACIMAIPDRHIITTPLSWGLYYATLEAASMSFFATQIINGSGTVFAAVTWALWLKGGYFTSLFGNKNVVSVVRPDTDPTDMRYETPASKEKSSLSAIHLALKKNLS